jgi:hypothetical protein
MGILEAKKVQVKRTIFKTYIRLSDSYQDENSIKQVYDLLVEFQPQKAKLGRDRVFEEIRKLTVSDIPVVAKL